MQTPFTLLFGMPSGSEWIFVIAAFAIIITLIATGVYLIKKFLNTKKEKQVINKL